jgi:hypothetical protein
MKISCITNETEQENDDGYPIPAVIAECSRCGHETQSFGTTQTSINRCLVLMREECPRAERNFYVSTS